MSEQSLNAKVRRISPFATVIDIQGELTSFTEKTLTEAYQQAVGEQVRKIILNFTELKYMNSFGMGMLVTLLIRSRREGIALSAYGLSEHYRHLFELTRIDQVVPVHSSEEIALAAAVPTDLPERES